MHNWVTYIFDTIFPVILLVLFGYMFFIIWKTPKLWKIPEKYMELLEQQVRFFARLMSF